jgi:molecular chaperone DnaK (HSP70)
MSTVIGINFGASASSVAVISKVGGLSDDDEAPRGRAAHSTFTLTRAYDTQDGLADCIANDDGERQISNAVSFSGEEEVSASSCG